MNFIRCQLLLGILAWFFNQTYGQPIQIAGKSKFQQLKIDSFYPGKPLRHYFEIPTSIILNPLQSDTLSEIPQVRESYFTLEGYAKATLGIQKIVLNDSIIVTDKSGYWEKMIHLSEGINIYTLTTYSLSNQSITDTIKLIYNKRKSTNYLLVIAANEYENWDQLKEPVPNANRFIDILIQKYQFERSNLKVLFNEDYTIDNLEKELNILADKMSVNDNLIIYYAGHGYFDKGKNMGYWIPADGVPEISHLTNSYLSNDDLISYIRPNKGRHILIIVDACFAGSLIKSNYRGSDPNKSNWEAVKLTTYASRQVLASNINNLVKDENPFSEVIISFFEKSRKNFLTNDLIYQVKKEVNKRKNNQILKSGRIEGDDHGEFEFELK